MIERVLDSWVRKIRARRRKIRVQTILLGEHQNALILLVDVLDDCRERRRLVIDYPADWTPCEARASAISHLMTLQVEGTCECLACRMVKATWIECIDEIRAGVNASRDLEDIHLH